MPVLFKFTILWLISLVFLAACSGDSEEQATKETSVEFQCDPDNGGLTLPPGFCAKVIADNLGIVRHIAIRSPSQIYASLRNRSLNVGGLLVLEDTDHDHVIDSVQRVGDAPGMGIGLFQNHLYFASDSDVVRYRLQDNSAVPLLPPEPVVKDFPQQKQHSGKPFAIDSKGNMYINVGSLTNACQQTDRKVGEFGQDPCPELAQHAGIWRFDATILDQTFSDGVRYASGIRNAYAIDWHPDLDKLFVVQHGRDHLHELWPEQFSQQDEARLPAEELLEVKLGSQYAWPYCYFDPFQQVYVLAPEYGGDGKQIGQCAQYPEPIIGFPGHYGPNDLIIYDGEQFPETYRGGAFIAFHGSYLVNATEQVGYQVVFVKKHGDSLSKDWIVFADGFAGDQAIETPQDADYRPTGLAVGGDGSLYISDSVQGRIWRVVYQATNN